MLSIVHNTSNWRQQHQYQRKRRDIHPRSVAFSRSKAHRQNEKASVILQFPLNVDAAQLQAGDIEEANIRFMLITSPVLAAKHQSGGNGSSFGSSVAGKEKSNRKGLRKQPVATIPPPPQKHVINVKVYQLLDKGRRRLDERKIEIDRSKAGDPQSQWLEFDVTKAVEGWLSNRQTNLGFEVKCENCYRHGVRIIDDISEVQHDNVATAKARVISSGSSNGNGKSNDDQEESELEGKNKFDLTPVLNIIGHLGVTHHERRSRKHSSVAAQHHHTAMVNKTPKRQPRKPNCYKDNQRCCRHTMEVIFKEIKGFEFIIQPKVFDAGYCRGRCPPRYNPAHHHAMLQSLIWKQDRTRVPRPCCAPSKLVELEVLHVDEKDSDKLKISTWTDMRVLECACS